VQYTLEFLKEKGYVYEREGALWFKATDFGLEKDEVLVRTNGLSTYFAADIAYHRNKFQRALNG
jgi:arginyl-tRNA synthetase